LNLFSNSIKFTPSGGFVNIKCTKVNDLKDLTFPQHFKCFKKSQGHGMLEITVTDSGIGISKEDQTKLFKLFGFLDSSKGINSKGIGLGLHISQ
jgi:signal transduction histidine kinase